VDVNQLRQTIIEQFSPRWELNDRGHRIEHFDAVEKCGLYINEQSGLGFDPKLILMFAYFHDLFTWDRGKHHLLSGFWIETSDHPILDCLDDLERKWVADACREHRASYKGEYSREFSELAASADRGFPGKVDGMLQRAILYRVDRGFSEEDARVGAIEHLKEKFGSTGYAKYPGLYEKVFGDVLEKQRKEVDSLVG
jgi:hypothetical protein